MSNPFLTQLELERAERMRRNEEMMQAMKDTASALDDCVEDEAAASTVAKVRRLAKLAQAVPARARVSIRQSSRAARGKIAAALDEAASQDDTDNSDSEPPSPAAAHTEAPRPRAPSAGASTSKRRQSAAAAEAATDAYDPDTSSSTSDDGDSDASGGEKDISLGAAPTGRAQAPRQPSAVLAEHTPKRRKLGSCAGAGSASGGHSAQCASGGGAGRVIAATPGALPASKLLSSLAGRSSGGKRVKGGDSASRATGEGQVLRGEGDFRSGSLLFSEEDDDAQLQAALALSLAPVDSLTGPSAPDTAVTGNGHEGGMGAAAPGTHAAAAAATGSLRGMGAASGAAAVFDLCDSDGDGSGGRMPRLSPTSVPVGPCSKEGTGTGRGIGKGLEGGGSASAGVACGGSGARKGKKPAGKAEGGLAGAGKGRKRKNVQVISGQQLEAVFDVVAGGKVTIGPEDMEHVIARMELDVSDDAISAAFEILEGHVELQNGRLCKSTFVEWMQHLLHN